MSETTTKSLFIGGGATLAAAQSLRERDKTARIVLLCGEGRGLSYQTAVSEGAPKIRGAHASNSGRHLRRGAPLFERLEAPHFKSGGCCEKIMRGHL